MFRPSILGPTFLLLALSNAFGDTVTNATLSGVKCRYSSSSNQMQIKCITSDGNHSCEESSPISGAGISMTRQMLRADCYTSLARKVGKTETIPSKPTAPADSTNKKEEVLKGKSEAFIQSYNYCLTQQKENNASSEKQCLEYGQFREEQMAHEQSQFEAFKIAFIKCKQRQPSLSDDECARFSYKQSKKILAGDCANLTGKDSGECDGSIWVRKDELDLHKAVNNSGRGSSKESNATSLGEQDTLSPRASGQ